MKSIRRTLLVGAASVLLLGFSAAGRAQEPDAPLVTVEVRGIQALVQDVNRVSIALQYGPMGALLAQQMQGALGGGKNFSGIDTNGTLRAYVYSRAPGQARTRGEAAPFVVALPTLDGGKAFMAAITNTLERGDVAEDITQFRMPGGAGARRPDLSVGRVSNQLVLGQDRARVSAMMRGMQAGQYGEGQRIGVPGTIAVNLNMPAMRALVQKAMAPMGTASAALKQANTNFDVGGMLKAEGEFLGDLLAQVDSLQLGVGTEPGNIVLASRMVAKPDSRIARITQSAQPPRRDLLGALPEDGAMFAQVGHLGDVDSVADLYMEFADKVFGSMGEAGAGLAPLMRDMMAESRGLGTGDYAISLGIDPNPVRLRQVLYFGVKNVERARALAETYVSRFGATNLFPGVHTRITAGPGREYNGVAISSFRYSTAMDASMLGSVPMPAFLGQLTNMAYELAFVGDVGVMTLGGPALMDASLDRLKSTGTSILDRPLFRSMFGDDPSALKASQVATFSLVDYVKFVVSMMPGTAAQSLDMIPASGSGVGSYTVSQGNSQVSVTKLGIAEIVTLKSMAPFLMMGAMNRSRGGQGMGGAPGYRAAPDDDAMPSDPEPQQ